MKTIELTQGKVALVDDEDFEWLSKWKWFAMSGGRGFYAARQSPRDGGKQRTVKMHREILKPLSGEMTDHINGDPLDNRRSNLRPATNANNVANKRKPSNNTSGFKGVSWHGQCRKWVAEIMRNGRKFYLGLYDSAEEAARAYDAKARELFGEFARPNFP